MILYMKLINVKIKVMIFIGLLLFYAHTPMYADNLSSQTTGKQDYIDKCANCHGADGKGNGPMADQLAIPPKNLTKLSKENSGTFPKTAVYNIIDGRRVTDFHGQEMPIWGEYFRDIENNEEAIEMRINAIITYLESIQTE